MHTLTRSNPARIAGSPTGRFVLALAAAMALAGAAHAGKPGGGGTSSSVKFSPPMHAAYAQFLECSVTNVSTSAVNVTIDVIGHVGYPVHQDGQTLDTQAFTVAPLSTQRLTVDNDNTRLPRFCRFTIEAVAGAVRATACAKDSIGLLACVAAD